MVAEGPAARPTALSVVLHSGAFERVHYGLVMASGAMSIGMRATLFFTGPASVATLVGPGWRGLEGSELDDAFGERGVARFEELLLACAELGGRFILCEMGLRASGQDGGVPRDDLPIEIAGVVTLLNDAARDGQIVFI